MALQYLFHRRSVTAPKGGIETAISRCDIDSYKRELRYDRANGIAATTFKHLSRIEMAALHRWLNVIRANYESDYENKTIFVLN